MKALVCRKDEYGMISCRLGRTNFVNLTPHKVVVQTKEGIISFPPSRKVLRLKTEVEQIGEINKVPLVRIRYTKQPELLTLSGGRLEPTREELPPIRENTYYIVSSPVIEHYDRPDFIAPDTTPEGAVRDPEGQIIGTKRWRA